MRASVRAYVCVCVRACVRVCVCVVLTLQLGRTERDFYRQRGAGVGGGGVKIPVV